jgi:hypothetical protein
MLGRSRHSMSVYHMFLNNRNKRKNRAKPVRLASWKGVEAYATPADKLTAVFSSVAYTPALHPYGIGGSTP